MNLLVIKADTNDADYIHSLRENVNSADLAAIKRVWAVVSKYEGDYNWGHSEYTDPADDPFKVYKDVLSANDIDTMSCYAPYGEHGIHTIESVTIYEFTNKIEL